MKKNTRIIGLLIVVVLLVLMPLLWHGKTSVFGGSDDAGSRMISEIKKENYEPWFKPVLVTIIGSEIPGEIESLFFSVEVGIGCSVLFFFFGRFYERNQMEQKEKRKKEE